VSLVERTARCTCGALSITAVGEPRKISACHCRACQRRTGSAFGVAVFYETGQTTPAGPSSHYTRMGDSGSALEFHFCPACGSTVYWYPAFRPGLVAIALGCFGGPEVIGGPQQSVYEAHRHPWVAIAADGDG
jgi:hypothetical protein